MTVGFILKPVTRFTGFPKLPHQSRGIGRDARRDGEIRLVRWLSGPRQGSRHPFHWRVRRFFPRIVVNSRQIRDLPRRCDLLGELAF